MENAQNTQALYTAAEAAIYLRCSINTLYSLMQSRKISFSKPGGKTALFTKESLDAYAAQNKVIAV